MAQLGLWGERPAAPSPAAAAGPERPPLPAPEAAPAVPEPPAAAEAPLGPAAETARAAPAKPAAPPPPAPARPTPPRGDVEEGPFATALLEKELNAPQVEAVVAPPGPLVVVAGAGSGKTRVITYRIARLVAAGADPRRILAVTFTNKAAGEMRERVSRLLWSRLNVGAGGLWVGTFHAVSARLLRQWGEHVGLSKSFVVYDDDDQRRLLARVLVDLQVSERMFPVRQVLSAIDRAKNRAATPDSFQSGDYFDDVVGKAWALYEQRLRAANATDFGGLLVQALRLIEEPTPAREQLAARFDHVLVDEFQDTNLVQCRLVRGLSRLTGSITVVGDEDQSIYRWRGADIRNILDFEREHHGARVVKLEQNYRSSGNILLAANAIISRNTERRPKRLFTEAGEGAPIVMFEGETERDEAEFVAARIAAGLAEDAMSPRDFAIFYRTNAQSRALEDAMRARDLPYVVVGGTRFFDRTEIKNLISYLRAILNPDDAMALARIVNVPARGIGDATVERVAEAGKEKKLSFWAALKGAASEGSDLLGSGPRRKVAAFVELMERLRAEGADAGLGPAALAEKVLEESGYRDALAGDQTLEAEGRLENLLEFVAQIREYEKEAEEPSLHGFLERVALVSDVDGYDAEKGAVSLMTVHTAKGLEFPTVFLTGLEERIFPHARSVDDDSAVEEERRLCYVAVTRARRHLYLSRVRRRRLSGQELPGIPSRFLREIPPEAIEAIVTERPAGYGESAEGQGPWGGGSWNRGPSARSPFGDDDGPPPSRMPPLFPGARGGGAAPSSRGSAGKRGGAPGELVVDYDDAGAGAGDAEAGGLVVGMKLRHPQFGVGEVRAWQGAGAGLKATVRFSSAGLKTILARFLTKP